MSQRSSPAALMDSDLEEYLEGLSMSHCLPLLRRHHITSLEALQSKSEQELEDIGLLKGNVILMKRALPSVVSVAASREQFEMSGLTDEESTLDADDDIGEIVRDIIATRRAKRNGGQFSLMERETLDMYEQEDIELEQFVSDYNAYQDETYDAKTSRQLLKDMSRLMPDVVMSASSFGDGDQSLRLMGDGDDEDFVPAGVWLTGAPTLWSNKCRGQKSKVAIIDTGVDLWHPGLNKENCKSEYMDSTYKEVTRGSQEWRQKFSHGTHVAGIIAGSNLSLGVAPEACLSCYSIAYTTKSSKDGRDKEEYSKDQAKLCVRSAVADGCDIIHLWLGTDGTLDDEGLKQSIEAAIDLGVVCVISSGRPIKNSIEDAFFIADLDYNLSEEGEMIFLRKSRSSDREIGFPGKKVLSTVPGGRYAMKSGAAMRGAHVAGIAALLLSVALKSGQAESNEGSSHERYPFLIDLLLDRCATTDVKNADGETIGLSTFFPEIPVHDARKGFRTMSSIEKMEKHLDEKIRASGTLGEKIRCKKSKVDVYRAKMKKLEKEYTLRNPTELRERRDLASDMSKIYKAVKDQLEEIRSDVKRASRSEVDISVRDIEKCDDEVDEARIVFLKIRLEDIDDTKDDHVEQDAVLKKSFLSELVSVFNELKALATMELREEQSAAKRARFEVILAKCERLKAKWTSNSGYMRD